MEPSKGQDSKEVLLGMYKEANQMLTEKVKQLSIENANLKKQIASTDVCMLYVSHVIAFQTSNTQRKVEDTSRSPNDSSAISDLSQRVTRLETELNDRDVEISKLRAEADVNARKILFLSHYATSMRHESAQTRKSAKRRLSDLTDRERVLYRKVSDECVRLVSDKVDPEQTMGEDLNSRFREACADLERSNQEMLDKFKSDFLELKQKLFSSIHSSPDLDS